MIGPASDECAEAVRGWLIDQIGGEANAYYEGQMPAKGGADAAHHFAVIVPIHDADSLFRLRGLSGPILSRRAPVRVVLVTPSTAIETRGRWARREVTVHVKGEA